MTYTPNLSVDGFMNFLLGLVFLTISLLLFAFGVMKYLQETRHKFPQTNDDIEDTDPMEIDLNEIRQ